MSRCAAGKDSPSKWMGYDASDRFHWFAPPAQGALCGCCWEQSACPKEFALSADTHETFFGMIPLNTSLAQRLVISVRSWIEPSQSFEKNQLGLKRMFLNSLQMCWIVSLLADSAALLRVLAVLKKPPAKPLLAGLFPTQYQFPFE